jgi:hypothetical protein
MTDLPTGERRSSSDQTRTADKERRSGIKMTPRQVASRRPPGYFEGSTSTFIALGLLIFLTLSCLGLGFTRPLQREAPLAGAFDQHGTFSYSATPKSPTPVYPTGSAVTGDPIYPSLVDDVTMRFSYRFSSAMPHQVSGTIELNALVLSQADTWQDVSVIKVPATFSGDTVSIASTLSLTDLYSLINTVSAQSGVTGAAYVADLQPIVHITGEVGGRTIHETFSPVLPFTVAPAAITLNNSITAAPPGATYVAPSANSELAATLNPSQPGSVDHLVTNVVPIAKYDIDVELLRVIGIIFAGLALALALTHDALRRRKSARSEEEHIARRYQCVVIPVAGLSAADVERIYVPGFANLAELAQYLERPILYETNGDERTFTVDDEHRRYVHRPPVNDPATAAAIPSNNHTPRAPAAGPNARQHRRSRKANIARGAAGILILLAVTATLVVSFTATTTVPTSNAGASRQALAVSQLAPAGCNSLALTGLVQGSGTFSNSRSNVLILGSTNADAITDTGASNCIIAGGGTNTVTATSSDICISGPTLAVAAACPTATPSNGVTVVATSQNYNNYGGQEQLTFTNSAAITALSITIKLAQTTGVTYNSQSNSFPGGTITQAHSTGGGVITYTYVLTGQAIPMTYAGGEVIAQFSATGSVRVTTGDTWNVTTTSAGISTTLTGTF